MYVVGGDMGWRHAVLPHNIYVLGYFFSRQCVICAARTMSESNAVAGPAPGRDRQQGQNSTKGKARDNGEKSRHKEDQRDHKMHIILCFFDRTCGVHDIKKQG